MALSLIKRFAVCIVFMVSITIIQHLNFKKSLFTNGNHDVHGKTQIEDDRNCQEKVRCDGIQLINRGVTMLYPNITIKGRFYKALEEFYKMMSNDPMAFQNIINRLANEFNDTHLLLEKGIRKFNNTIYENSTQALLVYLYTTKSNDSSIYYRLNSILRNHSENCNNKSMTETDENIAPYAAALTGTLFYWKTLKPTTENTYRGINRNISHQNNTIIMISYTSSSLDRNQAEGYGNITFYTITNNNQTNQMWQPKLIYKFSAEPNEQEALYPPGSMFRIVSRENNESQMSYNITLIDHSHDDDCNTTNAYQSYSGYHTILKQPDSNGDDNILPRTVNANNGNLRRDRSELR
ncbi:unnamed protein product [Mytilus coruscus]|uniref:NAD(P)(+)--arginine ADP-ribosyltransferase n=1 Tax=Mytilus coruscus TaxID=42192 RepID=A0A6J8F2S6_MYTCO|nr:unnamed protein product [Mytilus coruscus]